MSLKPLFPLAAWLLASTALVAADPKAKVLLIGKDLDHPRNTHTYMSDCELLARCLRQTAGVTTVVSNGWPSKTIEVWGNLKAQNIKSKKGGIDWIDGGGALSAKTISGVNGVGSIFTGDDLKAQIGTKDQTGGVGPIVVGN